VLVTTGWIDRQRLEFTLECAEAPILWHWSFDGTIEVAATVGFIARTPTSRHGSGCPSFLTRMNPMKFRSDCSRGRAARSMTARGSWCMTRT
jgi:hypothetical protein